MYFNNAPIPTNVGSCVFDEHSLSIIDSAGPRGTHHYKEYSANIINSYKRKKNKPLFGGIKYDINKYDIVI